MATIAVNANGTDDTTNIQSAVASGATSIRLPDSNYKISSTIVVPDHVDIMGAGPNTTTLTQLSGFDPSYGMFCCLNGGHNEFRDLSFQGNGVSTINDGAGAIMALMDAAATGPMGPVGIYHCRFSGFQSDNWLYVRNNGSYPIDRFEVEGSEFISVFGNSRYYGDVPYTMASFIQAWGNASNSQGSIAKLVIKHNYFDGTGIAGAGVKSWQNVLDTVCDDNEFIDVCRNVTALINVYVVLFYTQGGALNGGGSFCNNKVWNRGHVYGPACALYAASVGPVIASNNRIGGITRSDNQTLRRAALSFNGSRQVTSIGNQITGCATGIALSGYADQLTFGADSSHLIAANNIYSDAGASVGLNVSWLNVGTCAPKVALLRNLVKVSGTPVIANSGTYGSIVNDTV